MQRIYLLRGQYMYVKCMYTCVTDRLCMYDGDVCICIYMYLYVRHIYLCLHVHEFRATPAFTEKISIEYRNLRC